MNVGLLFNILGAAIHDGVPEDADILVCEDSVSQETQDIEGSNVLSAWVYEPPNERVQVLIASYPFTQMPHLRLLWEVEEDKG